MVRGMEGWIWVEGKGRDRKEEEVEGRVVARSGGVWIDYSDRKFVWRTRSDAALRRLRNVFQIIVGFTTRESDGREKEKEKKRKKITAQTFTIALRSRIKRAFRSLSFSHWKREKIASFPRDFFKRKKRTKGTKKRIVTLNVKARWDISLRIRINI